MQALRHDLFSERTHYCRSALDPSRLTPYSHDVPSAPSGRMLVKSRPAAIVILAAVVFITPLASDAQPAGKVWRIGFISSLASSTANYQAEGFAKGLRELGYMEGHNVIIDYRWAEGDYNRLPSLAKELIGLNPDLILCGGPPAA